MPLPELLRELAERDPLAYGRIDRQNPRRVIRAVEVIRLTGRPFSEQRAQWDGGPQTAGHGCLLLGLQRAAGDLRRASMPGSRRCSAAGSKRKPGGCCRKVSGKTRRRCTALGYRQVAQYLAGQRSLAETVELVKVRTRQLAKRQMTWCRRQMRLRCEFSSEGEPETEGVVEQLAAEWERRERGSKQL